MDAVQSYAQLEDASAAAATIFGDSMGQITAQADGAARTLGMSKSQVIDAANTFGTYGKAAGLAGDDLAGFSTGMTQLAGDMASFRGTSPEQAIGRSAQPSGARPSRSAPTASCSTTRRCGTRP